MSDLKKEIQKAIGETKVHKEKVWQSLQQPKRKNRMPLFMTAALVALASVWLLLLQSPPEKEQATSMQIGVTNQTKDGIAYTILHYTKQKPDYLNDDFAISLATSEETYKALSEQFKVPFIAGVDFAKNDILFALYTSGGCGLVIDKLTKSDSELAVHLALPADLRDEKELNCTTIAMPHLAVIEIEKQSIQQATFMEGKNRTNTAFNNLDLNEMVYQFDLLLNPDVIHAIEIKDLQNDQQIAVERDAIKNELPHLIFKATAVPGIVDMADPHYKISVQTNDGLAQQVYLWISPDSDTFTIMSSRNTHQIYTIPKSEAQFILSYLNLK